MRNFIKYAFLVLPFLFGKANGQTDTAARETVFEFNLTLPFYRDTLANDSLLHELVLAYQYSDREVLAITDSEVFGTPVLRERRSNIWRYIVLGLLMVCVGLARIASPGILVRYFRSFFNPKALEDLLSEQDSEIGGFGVFLAFFTSLIYALPLQYLLEIMGYSISYYEWGEFVLLALMVFGAFLLKLTMQAVIGRIMEMRQFVSTLLYASVSLNFAAATILTPIFLFVLLNNWGLPAEVLLLAVFIGVLVLVGIKLIRTLSLVGVGLPYSPFYLILYLCALEIIPWFLIYRLLELT